MPRATDPTPPPPGMVPCVPGNMLVDGPQAAWLAVHVVPFVRASGVRGDPAGRGGDGMMVVPARIGPSSSASWAAWWPFAVRRTWRR